MGSANITLDSLTTSTHPSDTINALKLDGGFNTAYVIDNDQIVAGTVLGSMTSELVAQPTFAANVVEFNQKILKIEPRMIGTLPESEFQISVRCLHEEIQEFQDAYENGDIIGMIDAITDLKYFGDGVLYKMGLTASTIDKVGDAVHAANMTKERGVVSRRGDGSAADAVKPAGWVSPEERIGAILDEQQGLVATGIGE